jgi:carboxypeptidase C (cathepsin A)
MFFWFIESRSLPAAEAPLTVWLQGGPGAGSTDQALSGHSGPCIVRRDSRTTERNPYSWTDASHMLYIDQPTMTGLTYDEVHEGVVNVITAEQDVSGAPVQTNWTMVKGKFASQRPDRMANNTAVSVRAVYAFLQLWFDE